MALLYLVVGYVILVLGAPERLTHVLLGTNQWAPDNVLNAAILEWGHAALRSGNLAVFDWPPGFPYHNTLAGTENLLGLQILYSPLRFFGLSITSAVNWTLVILFVASATFTAMLARQLRLSWCASALAGVIFGFVPFRLHALIQLQTIAVAWCPLAFLALLRLVDRPSPTSGLLLGASVALTALSSVYFGIFLVVAMLTFLAALYAIRRSTITLRHGTSFAVAAAVIAVLLGPVAYRYLLFGASHGFVSSHAELVRRSLAVLNLVHAPDWLWLWGDTGISGGSRYSGAFPGAVAALLVAIALIGTWRSNRDDENTMWWTLFVCLAVTLVLALGPELKIHPGYPSRISDYVPLPGRVLYAIPGLRMPFRMYLVALMFLALLAGKGADHVLRTVGPPYRSMLAALLILFVVVEYIPDRTYFSDASSVSAHTPESPDSTCHPSKSPVVDIPTTDSTGNFNAPMAAYTLESVLHRVRTTSYYLSHRPLERSNRLQAAGDSLPIRSARQRLLSAGVSRVVIHKPFLAPDSSRTLIANLRSSGMTEICDGPQHSVMGLESAP